MLIDIRDITKVYEMGEQKVHALSGVTLGVESGEYVGIMGPSGSGKSTLMNLIGCLDTPTSGSYVLNGREVARMTDDELAAIRNQEIGFVFQTFNLLPRTTALQQVELPLVYSGLSRRERRERAARAWKPWAGPTGWAIIPASYRAASDSAWRSPAPWSTTPRSSWPTSRRGISIPRPEPRSWPSSTT
jgi:ABC-type glutathione transport system ATPase component